MRHTRHEKTHDQSRVARLATAKSHHRSPSTFPSFIFAKHFPQIKLGLDIFSSPSEHPPQAQIKKLQSRHFDFASGDFVSSGFSIAGFYIMDGEHIIIAVSSRINLPSTRFAIGEESTDTPTINNHSTFKCVKLVKDILSEPLFNQLKNTFLGPIIKAALRPAGGAPDGLGLGFSAQLVHYLVARQITTTRNDELWFYFNNQPMRFSLREFHLVTGLPCYAEDNIQDEENINWPKVEGSHNPADLVALLPGLEDGESKVRMAMLLLLESIFLLKYSLKKSVFPSELLERGKKKMHTYLWGKMAFDLLVESVNELKFIPGKKKDLKGFPMALQLWMLASVSSFETAFARLESDTSALFVCERYTATSQPTYREILSVTDSKEATVISFLADEEDDEDDEVDWRRLVKGGYLLTELDWRRGFIEVDKSETEDKDEDELDKELNVQDEDEFNKELNVHDEDEDDEFDKDEFDKELNVQDEDEFNKELNVHDEDDDEGENVVVKEFNDLNVQYKTRAGRVSKDEDEDEFDKELNVQDEDEFNKELNVHDEDDDEGENVVVKEFNDLNVQYKTRVGRVSKPPAKFSPSGHKTKSRRL